jgi:hypothetical protein
MLCFLSATGLSYLLNTVARWFWLTGVLLPAISFCALLFWLFAFRRGEDVKAETQVSSEEMAEYEAAEALSQKLLRFRDRITLRKLLGLTEKVSRPEPVVRPRLRERR